AAVRQKNFTIPGTATLASFTTFFNGSVGPEANSAVESQRDDGGIDYGSVYKTLDVTPHVPVGQATEIEIKLWWDPAEGRSADLDIFVDVPGTRTDTSPIASEFDWNYPSKTITVDTVGVAGAKHIVGIQASNGRTTSDMPFTMQLTFTYEKDALGPGVPYEIQVPPNATGLVFESAKAGGTEHIVSQFVVIGPDDELVSFQEYHDIAIPLEQVFVPVKQPGAYVFYAYAMRGGFLTVSADVPPDQPIIRLLGTKVDAVVDVNAPTPGTVERAPLSPATNTTTPFTPGTTVTIAFETTFPLRVEVFVDSSATGGFTGAVQARASSPRGLVHDYQRVARLDGPSGTLGYSDDEAPNNVFHPENIDRGAWTITIVNDSNSQVGHNVLTYVR
ncbi:MAG TPA: hypothetical protein VI997_03005, partial [Candidatus Thermoplasmatota archaeon]|nr:hypothetical protein [Candidatus Thermoplasmatota archaeon]